VRLAAALAAALAADGREQANYALDAPPGDGPAIVNLVQMEAL